MKKELNPAEEQRYEVDPYMFSLVAIVLLLGANWLYSFSINRLASKDAIPLIVEEAISTAAPQVSERETSRMEEMLTAYIEKKNQAVNMPTEETDDTTPPDDEIASDDTSVNENLKLLSKPEQLREDYRNKPFLLYPKGKETFCYGQNAYVFWNANMTDAETVDVNLVAPWGVVRLDTVPTRNGKYIWHIAKIHTPTTNKIEHIEIPPSTDYSILLEVATPFMPDHNLSGKFTVKDCLSK